MYIVLMGYGKIGYHLARTLLAIGHEVLIIERDSVRCKAVIEELGSIALHGDGSKVPVQRKAGMARAEVFIALASDEDNLVACQIAKQTFSTPRTIAQVGWPENEAVFRLMGVDVVIDGTTLILSNIEEKLPGGTLMHIAEFRFGGAKMIRITIPEDASSVGRLLGEIEFPPHSFICLVVNKEAGACPISRDIAIHPYDEVIAVTTAEDELMLHETLTGIW
jgi:trk system potassium uptake protein TrkA